MVASKVTNDSTGGSAGGIATSGSCFDTPNEIATGSCHANGIMS